MAVATAAEIAALRVELDDPRRALLAATDGLGDEAFAQRPPRGGWCVAQVFEHLQRSETTITRGARTTLERGKGATPHWLDPLRRLPYRFGLADAVRVRTSVALDPPDAPGRAEVLAGLAASRAALSEFLRSLEGKDLAGLYLRHPFFGAFTLLEMLGFIAWHERRHTKQVARVRAAIGR